MAKIELNIVALGDFRSINTQLSSLKTQVDLLNKSLAGVGLSNNNNLTKQLQEANLAFKSTMLSTGQFTAQTVKLTSETDKFGQSLVGGKLKLNEYFSIIKNGTSNASSQMKALALEQTKLQNSIVMSDPTKQGVLSVYTPSKINSISNATKIAANMQNIYNIAVQKGSQELINWGKNTQWAGRQLTVGMGIPLMIFGQQAVSAFKDVNMELTRLQKVYGTGLAQPTKQVLTDISNQVLSLSKELASSMGIAVKDTASMAADLAATGKQGTDLIVATREAMRLQKLGEMSTQDAMQTTISLQNVYKLNTNQLADAVNFLNAVENQTSTSLQDLAAGIPKVGPIVQQLGGSFKDTAVMMVAMKEAGVPAAQSANAIKSAIASLINPTKGAQSAFAAFHINLKDIATSTGGDPIKMIMQLQQALKGLAPLAQAQLIEKLFGKFQEARIQALITNLGAVGSQTKTAFDLMNASSSDLANVAAGEIKTATESVTGRYQRAIETLKADIIPLGQKIMEIATTLINFGNSVAKVFSGLPGPVKTVLGIIAGGIALSGPVIMFTGLIANFVGYLLKGLFALKDLATGTKTFGQLFTPELIASQNAAEMFSKKMLEDAGSVDVLNTAVRQLTASLDGMISSMNVASATGFIEKAALSIPFKAPQLATGGFIPGDPSKGDAYPAMLMGGEAVIPTEQARKYAPFINAMIQGKLPGYAAGHTTMPFAPDSPQFIEMLKKYPSLAQLISELGTDPVRVLSNLVNTSMSQRLNTDLRDGIATKESFEKGFGNGNGLGFARSAALGGLNATPESTAALKEFEAELKRRVLALNKTTLSDQDLADETRKLINEQIHARTATGEVARALHNSSQQVGQVRVNAGADYVRAGVASGALEKRGTLAYLNELPVGQIRNKNGRVTNYAINQPGGYQASPAQRAGSRFEQELNIASESQSPSRATKRAAKNMVDGVVQGIKEGKPQVARAANTAFEEALIANQQGAGSISESENLATSSSPGLAATSKNRFGRIQSARAGFRSKLPKLLTGKFSGLGMGLGLQLAQQFAGPAIDKLPGGSIANDAITGASYGSFLGPEGAMVGAAFGGLFGGIKKLIDTEKLHAENAQATFKSSADAANMFGGAVQNTTTPVMNLDKIAQTALPKMDAIKLQAQNFADTISKLPKDNPMSLIFDQMKNSDGSKASQIATAFANTQIAIGNLDPAKAQKMIDVYLAATGHASSVGTPGATISTSVKDATSAAIKNSQGKTGLSYQEQQDLSIEKSILADPAYIGTAHDLAAKTIKSLETKAAVGNQEQLGKTLKDIIAPMENAAISAKDYADKIAAITENAAVNKNGLAAYATQLTGSTKSSVEELSKLNISLADGIKYATLFAATKGTSPLLAKIMADAKDPKGAAKLAADLKLLNDEIAKILDPKKKIDSTGGTGGGLGGTGTTTFTASSEQTKYKKLLEARVKDENVVTKSLNEQLKAYKLQVAEAQRLADYQQQSFSLLQDQKTALMSGNYLGAAEFKQASSALTVDYNATTKENLMQGTIDKVQLQADRFSTALADLNDAIANQSHAIDASIKKVAGERRVAADSAGTGTISVQNTITISSLDNATTIAGKVAAAAQSGTVAGIAAAKKQTNGKPVVTHK